MLLGKQVATLLASAKKGKAAQNDQQEGSFGSRGLHSDSRSAGEQFQKQEHGHINNMDHNNFHFYPAYQDEKLGTLKHQPLTGDVEFSLSELCSVMHSLGRLRIRSKVLLYLVARRLTEQKTWQLLKKLDSVAILRLVSGLAKLYARTGTTITNSNDKASTFIAGRSGRSAPKSAALQESDLHLGSSEEDSVVRKLLLAVVKPWVRKYSTELSEPQMAALSRALLQLHAFDDVLVAGSDSGSLSRASSSSSGSSAFSSTRTSKRQHSKAVGSVEEGKMKTTTASNREGAPQEEETMSGSASSGM
ncbi:unnamed protein product [Amoebophrya sp. A25]|nr:unnamed protein product [Amoebophrya sp. A25]|eukprot:GSA25T00025644001.1